MLFIHIKTYLTSFFASRDNTFDGPKSKSIWSDIDDIPLEDQRVQHQNSVKDDILKLFISCFKNLTRISGAIHDLINDTAYRFMSILVIS